MAMKTLDELFEHELKDIYYAEHRLVEALTQLAEETKNREIKRAYTSHKKETQGQIKRLQKVFRMFGAVPEVEKCPGIEGLLKEKQNFTRKEKPSQEILEYFNLGAASKTERYEITAYESLIEMAQQLGLDDAVELLSQTLQEEETALETMKALSQEFDVAALIPQEEEEDEEESGGSRGGSSKKGSAKGSAKGGSKGAAKGSAKGSAKGGSKGSAKGATKSSAKGAAKGSASGSTRGTASRGATGRNASTKSSAKGAASRGGSSKTASGATASGATASGANTSARGSAKRAAGTTSGTSSKGSRGSSSRGSASRGDSDRGGMADTGGMSGRDGMGGAGADENIMGTTMPAGASGPAPSTNDYAGDMAGEMIQTDPATAI